MSAPLRRIDHVVFWKLAHWLARKYRSRIKPLMRSWYRAPEAGKARPGLSMDEVNVESVSARHCAGWFPAPRRSSGGGIRRPTHTSSGAKCIAPARRAIMMLLWPWGKLEWRAVCAERCPYGSRRRSATALLTPLKAIGSGWLYLSTILDDYTSAEGISGTIISFRRCSDNGPCVSGQAALCFN